MAELVTKREERVQRGPNWVFVRLNHDAPYHVDDHNLGTSLWDLLSCNHGNRMILEFDDVQDVKPQLLNQLSTLSQRISSRGGVLRLTGVAPKDAEKIGQLGLQRQLPCFDCRESAIWAARPSQPR